MCGVFSSTLPWESLLLLIVTVCTDQSKKRPHTAGNKNVHAQRGGEGNLLQ